MKKRMSRIIAIMLVLLMVVCNQSYSSMASDTDNSISEEAKTLSGENEAGYTEVATDSDAGIEVNNAVIAEEDKNTDTEEDTEANDNSDEEINSDMKDIADESEVSEEGEDENTYPLFVRSCSVDGIRVTVTASEGAFPEGATLSVNKVTDSEKEQINQAVEAVRDDSVSVAEAYTFDIKVLDENGTELQPANGQTVNVSFAMDEVSNQNLSTDIYHIPEENGNLVAEELSTSESGNTVTAVSDGFSYYTVEFTYNEKQYVMQGDSSVALTDILSYVGITKADGNAATDSDITAVSVSDESLFSASNESGEWIVTAHQAFHTDEWMKVTVDGVEYEIVVTDALQYKITVTESTIAQSIPMGTPIVYTVDHIDISIHKDNSNSGVYLASGRINGSTGTVTFNVNEPANYITIIVYASGGISNGVILRPIRSSDDFTTAGTMAHVKYNATIPSVNPTYTAPTSKTMQYNGSAQDLVNAGSVSAGGSMDYAIGTSATTAPSSGWSASVPTDTNVGTYYVWYRINAANGYNAVAAKCVTSTISKADNPIAYANQTWNYTFSTTNQTKTLAQATNNQGDVTYSLQSQKSGTTNVNYFSFASTTRVLTANANTPAGTYSVVVRAMAAGNTNYNSGYKDSTITVTVGKATMTGVSATGYTDTYDASGHSITVTAPDGATVKYRTTDSGDYNLGTAPTYTDVGIYTVYYQVTKANYETVTGSKTVQINPIELTLTWGDETSFTYNGSPQVPTATISGVINGDDCTVSVNGAKTDYSASPYTATAVLNGAKKGNYKLPTENTKPFTISKKAATIIANDQTVTYGTSIASTADQVATEGLVTGDTLTAITLTPSTSDVTTDGTITPSAAVIKNGDTDVTNNYNITYNTGSLTINKKPITISGITASNKTYDGTTAATLNYSGINWAACGKVESDDLSVTATGAFSDAGIGTGKTVTISDLALSGAKAGNYELAESGQQTSTTANITAKSITITADSDSKVYDGTTHTKNSYSVTSGVLAEGDTVESVTVTGSQKYAGSSANVPSAAVIKNSSGVDVTSSYNITYTNGTLTVTQKPLTITADSDTKVYDTAPLTKNRYTNTELAAGDTIESVTITGSQTAVGESDNVPSAAVIKNGDDDVTANYDITYANGTLEVTKKAVTITADNDTNGHIKHITAQSKLFEFFQELFHNMFLPYIFFA